MIWPGWMDPPDQPPTSGHAASHAVFATVDVMILSWILLSNARVIWAVIQETTVSGPSHAFVLILAWGGPSLFTHHREQTPFVCLDFKNSGAEVNRARLPLLSALLQEDLGMQLRGLA